MFDFFMFIVSLLIILIIVDYAINWIHKKDIEIRIKAIEMIIEDLNKK